MLPASFFVTALILGAISSFHCVGMCGPLVLGLPVAQLPASQRFAGLWIYHAGRVSTYMLIGIIMGIVGRQISLAGWQQVFSLLLGCGLIVYFISTRFTKPFSIPTIFRPLYTRVQAYIIRMLQRPTLRSMLTMGMANGWLPCGMVYVAATGAMASGSWLGGAGFMMLFGLATVPILFLLSLIGQLVDASLRSRMRNIMSFTTLVIGIMLIIRGLNLHIPFISSMMQSGTSGTAIDCGN
ncbi:MAG: sulfite exporter TauE/SafE family protein [Sediminibacterium sp.]|nr:sulfite exporter TauE/SafE family protein [Sediminibacterium sp.]